MKTLTDYQGRLVRLTDERLEHILEHPEMANLEAALAETLEHPSLVVQSRSDPAAELPFLPRHTRRRQMAVCGGKVCRRRCVRVDGVSDRPTQERRTVMADQVRIWFDAEGDFLEVRFSDAAGYEKATQHDAVMERVDAQGKVIGFSVMGVSRFKKSKPLVADLQSAFN